jgi:putative membrane protein
MTRQQQISCAAIALCGVMSAAAAQLPDQPAAAEARAHEMQANSGAPMSEALTDQAFVAKAAQSGMAEVELSQLALQNSKDEQVRSFAQQMVQDHEKANMELKSIAQKHNLQVPPKTDAKHQQALEKLKGQSGAQFDAAYSKDMKKDHDAAVALFTEASNAQRLNPDLKSFAAKTRPTLQTHHRLASNLPSSATRAAQSESESKSTPR